MWRIAIVVGLGCAVPAGAQDISSPYDSAITDHAQIQLESNLAKRRLQQAQQRRSTTRTGIPSTAISPRSRAICRDKERLTSRLPAAKAQRLYALCAQVGL